MAVWVMIAVATCRACGYDLRLPATTGPHERAECPCARSSISVVEGLIQERGEAHNARWEGQVEGT